MKAAKGSVVVYARGNHLHVRFRVDDRRYRFALGLPDNKAGRKKAEQVVKLIEYDVYHHQFNPDNFSKYLGDPTTTHTDKVKKPESTLTLLDLWQRYAEIRKNLIAETTFRVQYKTTQNHIAKLPPEMQSPSSAIAIRDLFLQRLSLDATTRLLTQLSACCTWAMESGLIPDNPFHGLARKLKRSTKSIRDHQIDPFDKGEMEAIIQAFEADPRYNYYAPYVKFLFFTGCRTGEAIALKWKHVASDCSEVSFEESVSTRLKIRKQPKTYKSRKFPCNPQLQSLLQSIRPENPDPNQLVFPSKTGREITASTFLDYAWRGRDGKDGIVTRLVKAGVVKRYRTQYNTRHTFITIALEKGIPPALVAKWVGNSVQTIMNHYLGVTVVVAVPEL